MSSEVRHPQNVFSTTVPAREGPLQRGTHSYELMRQCIHCGFCLPTCPTYAVLGVEMDSPRGRIYQMQAVAEGRMGVSDDFIEHMNCCLGCRACETACPSGVQYGKLIEAAREQIQLESSRSELTQPEPEIIDNQFVASEKVTPASWPQALLRRFFFGMMLPSRLLTSLVFAGLKIYQRSGLQTLTRRTGVLDFVNDLPTPFKDRIRLPEKLMPTASGSLLPLRLPTVTPAIGKRRYRVGFISGCIMDQVFRDINDATIRVLTANGCEVITPPEQQCCGALHVHAGEAEQGRALARKNIDVFASYALDAIIINSAGCGSTLKEYAHLLRDDPDYKKKAAEFSEKMQDVSEFLAGIELNTEMGQLNRTAAYHDACHLLHGQKIKQQPRNLLKQIPGLRLVELKESDWCCGSAGIYNITNQEMGSTLLERKIKNIVATGADVIATGNPGCMMQIALGARERDLTLDVVHPVQLLDAAYQAGGRYTMTETAPVKIQRSRTRILVVGIVAGFLLGTLFKRPRPQ